MVVAWAVISVSRSSSLARDGILLSCLVEVVGGEVVIKVVVQVMVEVMGEIGEGGVKLFTVCCLSICFHQVPGTEKIRQGKKAQKDPPGNLEHQNSVLSLISAGSRHHSKDTRQRCVFLLRNTVLYKTRKSAAFGTVFLCVR